MCDSLKERVVRKADRAPRKAEGVYVRFTEPPGLILSRWSKAYLFSPSYLRFAILVLRVSFDVMLNRVILHPSVLHFTSYATTVVGRDKLIRLLQYYALLCASRTKDDNGILCWHEGWVRLTKQLALARKLLRVGRGLESIQTAAKLINGPKKYDLFLDHIPVLQQLLSATYLTCDNATVLDSLGVYPWKGAYRVRKEAARLLLGVVCCGLATRIYCYFQLLRCRYNSTTTASHERMVYL